jgi:hypothetical protein
MTQMERVYCAVRTESLSIIHVNPWVHSAAHTIFVYGALKIRQNLAILQFCVS